MQARTKFLLTIVVAAFAALALSACASGSSSSAASASASTTSSTASSTTSSSTASSDASSSDSPEAIPLDASDTVFIPLEYSAGTGYEWKCTPSTEGVLKQVDKKTEDMSEPGTTGGTLRDTYTFTSVNPGEVTLTFELVRSWEEGADPAETQVYSFTVNKGGEVVLNPYKSDFKLQPDFITYS